MNFLHTFFELNRQSILFLYGLCFFVLGLATALQSRQHSRLDLARNLPWLALFGLLHGLDEWGDLFLPIQRAYLSQPAIQFLNFVQMSLLSLSFTCLFLFGVLLLRPTGRARLLLRLPLVLFLAWALGALFFQSSTQSVGLLHREADALARYAIGFPGALLAAYGLQRQVRQRIAPLNMPHAVPTLQVAIVALALYAVFAGLVPAPVPFFPGNLLNTETFESAIGIPPSVLRSAIGLVLAVAIIRALDIFDVETDRFIESMEQGQILAAERERLARELHDGVIQKVYTAGLLIESAQRHCPPDAAASARLERATAALNDAIADLRRHLGELQPASAGCPLPEALSRLACDPRFQPLVDLTLELNLPDDPCLAAPRADQVVSIVQEALSNIARHARARHARIQARRVDNRLELTVEDDGVGLPRTLTAGYGLRNMRDRAHLLGGELEVRNAPGRGTRVSLDIPWSEER